MEGINIEILFELLLQLILDIVGQIIFEIAAGLGWESLKNAVRRERKSNPALAWIGHFLLGLIAGTLSLLIISERIFARPTFPGVSLLLSPLGTGVIMELIGDLWLKRGKDRPVLFSFGAGAIFALGMALVRFVYLEIRWTPF